jgi:asparagine synthase (glutamine-hydrolysing)
MKKGGPDGEGIHEETELSLVFGHRRLSLIDLSEQASQPMVYDTNYWITFNGEIYNFNELKADLINKGCLFSSQSDTEVILAGYQAYGESFFAKLKGMFAFALLDKVKKQTFLVRDSMGIKPLYYHQNDGELYFASEVKAFKVIDSNWPAHKNWSLYFLSFGFIPEPYTTLDRVYSLAKSHYLVWDHQKQKANIVKYSAEHSNVAEDDHLPAEKIIRQRLNHAVKRHLIADAPIGVFLSGGIDSSLLSLIAAEQSGKTINTVSINFNEQEFSEQVYQTEIAKRTNSNHISYTVTQADFETHVNQIFADMDQPSNDGINSWFVNKVAQENGLKAVLSGIGADELYGGYPSFKRYRLLSNLQKIPKFVLKLTKYFPNEKLKRISFLALKNPIGEYLFLRGFFATTTISKLLGISEADIFIRLAQLECPIEVETLQAEDRISWFETNIYMQNQLLKDTDYMSMAHGVEVRVPFLDQDLVASTLKLNRNQRFDPKQAKHLLIKAYADILPEQIWNRPKKGFTFPFQTWFQSYAPFQNGEAFAQNKASYQIWKKFKSGRLHWSKLFALYQVIQTQKSA